MKSIFTFGVAFFLCVLSLNASSYPFEIVLDENGFYETSEKEQDLSMSIRIVYGTVNVPVASLKIEVPSKADPIYSGSAGKDEQIPINVKTRYMKLTVNDPALANQTIKFVAEWKFSKGSNALMSTLKTNNKGKAKYYSDIKSGEFNADSIVVSEDCKLTVKADGQKIFCQQVESGQKYAVNMRFSQSLQYKVSKAPKNKDVTVYMDVFGGAIMQNQDAGMEDLKSILAGNNCKEVFYAQANSEGCIHTEPHTINTQGTAPEVKVIAINEKFDSCTIELNGMTFNPKYLGKIGRVHFYVVGVSFKNDKLDVGLIANGGKPMCSARVTVYYRGQSTNE